MSNFPFRAAMNKDFKKEEEEPMDIYSSDSEDETETDSSDDDDVPLRLVCDDCLNFFMEIRQGRKFKNVGTQTDDSATHGDNHLGRNYAEASAQTDNLDAGGEEEDSVSYKLSLSSSDDGEKSSLNGGGEEDSISYQLSLNSSDDGEDGVADIQNNSINGSGNLGKRRFESNGADDQQGNSSSDDVKRAKTSFSESNYGDGRHSDSSNSGARKEPADGNANEAEKSISSSADKKAEATSSHKNGGDGQTCGSQVGKKASKKSEEPKNKIRRPNSARDFWISEARRVDPLKYKGKSSSEMQKEWAKVEDISKWNKLAADEKKRYAEDMKKAGLSSKMGAYRSWLSENYRRIAIAHPGLSNQEVMRIAGEEWKTEKKAGARPKKPANAYNCWMPENFRRIANVHPGLRNHEVMRIAAEEWKNMGDKSKWIKLATEEKERYENEMAAFEQVKGEKNSE